VSEERFLHPGPLSGVARQLGLASAEDFCTGDCEIVCGGYTRKTDTYLACAMPHCLWRGCPTAGAGTGRRVVVTVLGWMLTLPSKSAESRGILCEWMAGAFIKSSARDLHQREVRRQVLMRTRSCKVRKWLQTA